MEDIAVRKRSIPPDGRSGPRSPYSVAIVSLEPGQSFKAPLGRRGTLSVLCTFYGRKLGRTFGTRKDGEIVLVFRVA